MGVWIKRLRRLGLALALLLPAVASANLLLSPHFQLDPNVANTFGGAGASTSYKLTDSGGEAAVGSGSSTSYKLTQGYISQLAHSLQISVLPTSTYAYWPMDTGSGGLAYDVSTNADNGSLVAGPTWSVGKIGNALTFNGSTQYVSTANSITSPAAFTVELWFKTNTGSGGKLIGFGSSQTGGSATFDRNVYMTNAGNLVYGVNNGTIKTVTSAGTYNNNVWHHLAATLGGSGLTLVVDGIRVGTDATTTSANSYSGYWRIGYDALSASWPSRPTSDFYAGSLDEVHVYTRQLSDAEASGDYSAGNSGIRFAQTLPNITPGTSQTYSSDVIIQTDAGGYDLFISTPQLLTHTDTVTTIPAISSTIASPAGWTEGTTKGLGFTVSLATQLEAKWSAGTAFAAIPALATAYHSRIGLNGGVPEKTSVQFRADTTPSQKQGAYSTTVIYTVTLKP